MKEMLEFPPDASGLLVSGGSMANFVGLAVARNVKAGFDVRALGTQNALPSYTTLQDRYCLRIAVANHRSRQADFDLLAEHVVRIGGELSAQA